MIISCIITSSSNLLGSWVNHVTEYSAKFNLSIRLGVFYHNILSELIQTLESLNTIA